MRFESRRGRVDPSQRLAGDEGPRPAEARRESVEEQFLERLGFSPTLAAANFGCACIADGCLAPEILEGLVKGWKSNHHPDLLSNGSQDARNSQEVRAFFQVTTRQIVDALKMYDEDEFDKVASLRAADVSTDIPWESKPLKDVTLEIIDAKKLIDLCIDGQRQENASRRLLRDSEQHFVYLARKLLDFGPLEPERRKQYSPFRIGDSGGSFRVVEPRTFLQCFKSELTSCALRYSSRRPEFRKVLWEFNNFKFATDGKCWAQQEFSGDFAVLQELWCMAIDNCAMKGGLILRDAAAKGGLRFWQEGDLAQLYGVLNAEEEIERLPSVVEEFLLNGRLAKPSVVQATIHARLAREILADSRRSMYVDTWGIIRDDRGPGVPFWLVVDCKGESFVRSLVLQLLKEAPATLAQIANGCAVTFSLLRQLRDAHELFPRRLTRLLEDEDWVKGADGTVPSREPDVYQGLLVSRRWDGSNSGVLVLEGFVVGRS
jgi:hypothetical protein